MELVKINRFRRRITFISISFTVLILIVYLLAIFFIPNLFIGLLGIIVVLALLYILSKFYVYKQYLILKYQVISLAILKKLKAQEIVKNNDKANFIYHFYIPSCTNIKASFTIISEGRQIQIKEFEITQKRNFKSNKVVMAGKYIKSQITNKALDCAFILNYQSESNKYINFYQDTYKNKKSLSYKNTNKQYICYYNENFDIKYLEILDKITAFHIIKIKDGIIEILYLEKLEIFDFKLQNVIDEHIINHCGACYEKMIKIIDLLKKVENNV